MLNSGEVFAGFTVERLLGQGGMGSVYLARHPRLQRQTALKLLNRDLFTDAQVRARFEREADLAAQLDHPSIVAVYDRGNEDGQLWISMQYVDGVDASTVHAHELPPERAVQIIEGVAEALDYAHGMGVLHRDVKPANIMLARSSGGQGERVFLTDFGIARLREDSTHLTQVGMFTATLAYASPEQMTGTPLDNRSDQYSLACALYWLLAGVGPFDSVNPNDIIRGHLQMPLPPLASKRPGLSPALDLVLARGMAKRADQRFATCAEFAAAARHALTAPAPPPMPVPVGYPAPGAAPPPFPPPGAMNPAAGHPASVNGPAGPPSGAMAALPPAQPPPPGQPPLPPGAFGGNAVAQQARSSRRLAATIAAVGWTAVVIALVVLLLAVIAVVVLTGDSEQNDSAAQPAPVSSTAAPAAAQPPDPVTASRRAFPYLLPQGNGPKGDSYEGATCMFREPDEELTVEEPLGSSDWSIAWQCGRPGTTPTPFYTILGFDSPDEAHRAFEAMSRTGIDYGRKSGSLYATYQWVSPSPSGPLAQFYHTANMLVSFHDDPARSNYLLYISYFGMSGAQGTTPPTAQQVLMSWWAGTQL